MMQESLMDWFLQIVAFPTFVGIVLLVMFATYYLTGPNESRRGLGVAFSAKTVGNTKHMLMNFIIILFGAVLFSFFLWQSFSPLPWLLPGGWLGLDTEIHFILVIGLLLGISFGFLTFLSKYRGSG